MKKLFYLLLLFSFFAQAQVGINTTDPKTTLDVNGAITIREVSYTVAANAVNINTETSLANITGAATATVAVTCYVPLINGHRLIIANNTTGGFGATFASVTVPNAQSIEFIYTNGAWKSTSATGTGANIYNSDGTLTGTRTVTQSTNDLTFTGTGNTIFNTGKVGVGTSTPIGKLNVAGGLTIGSGTNSANTTGIPFAFGNTTNSALWFGNYNNTASSDYAVIYKEEPTAEISTLNILSGDNANGAGFDDSVFIGNLDWAAGTKKGVTIKNGNVGIGTTSPSAQLHTTGSVLFAGAGTPALGKSLVTDATGLATWQNPLASNTASTAITASTTQVAVPSTNVQGAISDLATAIKSTSVNAWNLDGNTNGAIKKFGTTDAFDIPFITSNTERMRILSNGNIGIGTTTPNAPLQFANTIANRKVVLWETINNDHQFYGFGINANTLRYQVDTNASNHIFYAGTSATTSNELMRIQGNGNVGIGSTNPTKKLTVENGSIRPAIGNSQDSGISFPLDPGGGGGDEAFVRYYAEAGEDTKLSIGVNNDANDDISFYQMGAERMNIYNGNVGIGITTPVQRLDVQGGNARINTTFIGDVGWGSGWGGIAHYSQANTTGYGLIHSSDGNYTFMNKQNTGAGYLGFRIGNTDQAVILNNGNMGIGTTNPSKKFTVENGSIRPAIGNSGDAGIEFPTDPGGGSGDEAFIRYFVEAGENTKLMIGNNNDFDDDISFFQSGSERMNIYNGNVGIGTTTPSNPLTMGGGAYCNSFTWVNASDARLKDNIKPMNQYGLAQVLQLKPVTYYYKKDTTKHQEVGFIAQEVKKIIPEVVTGSEGAVEKGETLGLSYGNMVPVLTKAIQEQQAIIEELKKKIEVLEQKVNK